MMVKKHKKIWHSDISFFKDVKPEEWDDWKWQLKNTIKDVDTLEKIIDLSSEEKYHLNDCLKQFKMAITPYYASLMKKDYARCSIRLQAVPSLNELYSHPS